MAFDVALRDNGGGDFDVSLDSGGAFDAAYMAAMNRPHPIIAFSPVRVAASGLTPSDYINNP